PARLSPFPSTPLFRSLHVSDLRICHGLAELAFVEPDARTRDVARVFRAALRARFDRGDAGPNPYTMHLECGSIDRIVAGPVDRRSEEHTSELQSRENL